jgi:hypothetical protein
MATAQWRQTRIWSLRKAGVELDIHRLAEPPIPADSTTNPAVAVTYVP